MTAYKESLSLFRKIAPGLKVFLAFYLAFQLFPIYHLTGSTIQPAIGDLQFRLNNNLRRIIVTLVFIYAFLINDPMLVALMVLFILHDTKINYKKEFGGY